MDDATISALKASLSFDNFWIELSTVAVVVGVIVEFAELLLFNKEMTALQRRLLFVGTFFVVVGCAGEFVFEGRASEAETKLQQQSDEKVAALTRAEAADNRIAQHAASDAAALGVKLDALPSFVETKEGEIDRKAKALRDFADTTERHDNETIAALNKGRADLDRAGSAVQMSEKRTSEIWNAVQKQSVARVLTNAQRDAFLAKINGKSLGKVLFRAYDADQESLMYSYDFVKAMKGAGFDAEYNPWGLTMWIVPERSQPDMLYVMRFGRDSGPAEKLIAEALKSAGIPSKILDDKTQEERAKEGAESGVSVVVLPHHPVEPDGGAAK